MKWLTVVFILLTAGGFVAITQAPAHAACPVDVGFVEQTATCYSTGAELRTYMTSTEGAAYAYRLNQLCADEGDATGACDSPRACTVAGGVGTLYSVSRRPVGSPGAQFEAFAVVCLTAGEEDGFDVITWRRVWSVMRQLDWPQADLLVQPVGGRTLVNFETNVFTSTTEPSIQRVALLGQNVEIRATPSSYTWHWSDGSKPGQTDDPGAAHVDGTPHRVFHVYSDAGVRVRPSVDVTYRGEFRVEGEGSPWRPIPETLTVAGDPVVLEVVAARVQLVG